MLAVHSCLVSTLASISLTTYSVTVVIHRCCIYSLLPHQAVHAILAVHHAYGIAGSLRCQLHAIKLYQAIFIIVHALTTLYGQRTTFCGCRQEEQAGRKEKTRKDYAFRRQFNEKPSIIPGCPVAGWHKHWPPFVILTAW